MNVRLLVLTTDPADVLTDAIAENGYTMDFARVEPAQWEAYGLQNTRRPELPWPATFVIAPDGELIYREVHKRMFIRSDDDDVLDFINSWMSDHSYTQPAPEEPPPMSVELPSWSDAMTFSASASEDELKLTLNIAPGYHAYGVKEEIGRPLRVEVNELPDLVVEIPDGADHELSTGHAWVLEGAVELNAPLPEPGQYTGTLHYQLCTETSCDRPTSVEWSAN